MIKEALHAGVLAAAYRDITGVVTDLGDEDLLAATRCRGWVVADLLLHLLEDVQRALVALATPTDAAPDTDAVTYWLPREGVASPPPLAHAWYVRRATAAYRDPRTIVGRWAEESAAAARALRASSVRAVRTQDRTLALDDFAATLVVEACVHHLDLVVDLPDAAPPGADALAATVATLDGLARAHGSDVDRPALPEWDTATYVLKGAGRVPLTDEERTALGAPARIYPLLR